MPRDSHRAEQRGSQVGRSRTSASPARSSTRDRQPVLLRPPVARGRSRHSSGRRSRRPLVALAALIALAGLVLTAKTVVEPGVSITVDFTSVSVPTPRSNIGFTATTLGVDGGTVVDDPRDAAALGALGAGAVRIHLRSLGGGEVVTGAKGGVSDIPAARWLTTYAHMGVQLTVIVDLNRSGAVDVLQYLRASGYSVHRFVLGNEMDGNSQADVSPAEYVKRFREIAKAMRAIDPTLEIGGPAPAYFEGLHRELLDGLLQAPPDERASFIDFHAYGAGQGEQATMSSSWQYADQLDRLRGMIAVPGVDMQVGEFNVNWSNEPQNNTQFQSVWVASALGTILSRGAVAFQYGDKNNAAGLVADGTPKPSYWGMAAFTGAKHFRAFGNSMVSSTSSKAAVRVFASTGDKNIVIVNTGETSSARVTLNGFAGGTAAVWQNEAGEFHPSEPMTIRSSLDIQLPAMSITTVVLDETR